MSVYYCYKNSKNTTERKAEGTFVYNGLDRIDNALGHSVENVVTCCWRCNKAKGEMSQREFLNWIATVYTLHC